MELFVPTRVIEKGNFPAAGSQAICCALVVVDTLMASYYSGITKKIVQHFIDLAYILHV